MALILQPMTCKNDVSLCKLDVTVKNRTAVAGSVGFFKLELKLFKGKKHYFIQVHPFEIKCGKSKGMKEKVSTVS